MVCSFAVVSESSASGSESSTIPPAGPGAGGEAVTGYLGAADGDHVLSVAGGVAPADGAGIETAIGLSGADKGLRGSGWGAADGWRWVAAHRQLKGRGGWLL